MKVQAAKKIVSIFIIFTLIVGLGFTFPLVSHAEEQADQDAEKYKIPEWVSEDRTDLVEITNEIGDSHSLRFEAQTDSTTDMYSKRMAVEGGVKHTVTASVYMSENVSHSLGVYILTYDEQGNALDNLRTGLNASVFTEGDWVNIEAQATLHSDAKTLQIRFYTGAVTTMVGYIDHVRLFAGEHRETEIVVPNGDFEMIDTVGEPVTDPDEGNDGEDPASPYADHIENPYFDLFETAGWLFEDPSGGPYITNEKAYSGEQSLKFIALNGSNTDVRMNQLDVNGKEAYRMNAKVWMEENVSHSLGVYFVSLDENGVELASDRTGLKADEFTVGEWTDISVEAEVPVGTAKLSVRFYTGAVTTMVGYIDDVELIEIDGAVETPLPLDNGGFEGAVTISGWETNGDSVQLTSKESYSGSYSVELENDGGSELVLSSHKIDVTAEQTYIGSAQYKILDGKHSGGIRLKYYDDTDLEVGSSTQAFTVQEEWSLAELQATAPDNAAYAVLEIVNTEGAGLHAYIDAVQFSQESPVEEEPPTYPAEFENAGFEEGMTGEGNIPSWTVSETHEDSTLEATTAVANSGEYSLYFHDNHNEAGLRIQSSPIAAESGKQYLVSAEAYILYQSHRIVLDLEFFDSTGQLLDTKTSLFNNLPLQVWTSLPTSGVAPNGTAYATLSLYSGGISHTEVYFDDIHVSEVVPEPELETSLGDPVLIGQPVKVPLAQGGKIKATIEGHNEVYMVSNGDPGVFHALDGETGELLFKQSLVEGDETVWGMAFAPNGDLYFASDSQGILYKYDPFAKEMVNVGVIPTDDKKVWALTATEDGMLYGGTYPGASVFGYDTNTGEFENIGRIHPTEQYVRGITATDTHIYAAIGSTKYLYKIDRETHEKEEVVIQTDAYPDHQSGESGFYSDVWVIDGKLFIQSGAGTILVVEEDTLEVIQKFEVSDQISPPSPYNEDLIYFKANEELVTYNLATNEVEPIEGIDPLPDTPRVKSLEWITLQHGAKAGRTVLAATTQYSEYFIYDPIDHEIDFIELDVEPQAVNIQSIEASPDNKLFIGGFQRGMTILDPETDEILQTFGIFRQAEGIGFKDNVAYFGTYTGAQIYRYDPDQPDDFGSAPDNNPGYVYQMPDEQDRPFAVASGDDHVFIGSVPGYGLLGGSLAIYDERTDTWESHRNVVDKQSVIGLAYKDGLLYGGTSIWGGQGGSPEASEAKMFIWDVEQGTKVEEFTLDIPDIDQDPKMIGALSFGPDGLLWGAVDGTIFAMDTDTKEIVKSKVILPSTYSSSKWRPHYIRWGKDGLMYTTLSRELVVIDPDNLQYKVFDELNGVDTMALSADGSVYYAGTSSHLYKLPYVGEEPEGPRDPDDGGGTEDPTESEEPDESNDRDESEQTEQEQEKKLQDVLDRTLEKIKSAQGNVQIAIEAVRESLADMNQITAADLEVVEIDGQKRILLKAQVVRERLDQIKQLKETLQAELKEQGLDEELFSEEWKLTIETEDDTQGEASLELSGSDLQLLNEENVGLSLRMGQLHFELPASLVEAEEGESVIISSKPTDETLRMGRLEQLQQLDSENEKWMSMGGMFDFEIMKDDGSSTQEVERFNGTIQISLPLEQEWTGEGELGVFRYQPDTESWQYVGGKVQTDGTIQFSTPHFSTYAIFSYYKAFDDTKSHWAEQAIDQLASKQIVMGMSAERFAPEEGLTRAQFTAWLVRALQLELPTYEPTFGDVEAGAWYAAEVQAAYEAGLVSGYNDGSFNPDQLVTRQEMAVMVAAALSYAGLADTSAVEIRFTDMDQISPWAIEDVNLAAATGVIHGREDQSFAPEEYALRAEAAALIHRFVEKL